MSAEGESSPNHLVVPTDTPGTSYAVDMATNKHILNSLNNIDQTIGQMADLIARFCGDRRPIKAGENYWPMLHPILMSPSKNMNITQVAQILKEHEKLLHRTTI